MQEVIQNYFSHDIFKNISNFDLVLLLMLLVMFFLLIFLIKIYNRSKILENQLTLQKEKMRAEENQKQAVCNELDEILEKLRKEEENKEQKTANFEDDEEEQAIISYQQLKKAAGENVNEMDSEREEIAEEEKAIDKEKNSKTVEGKFRTSEIISPVFGRIKIKDEYVEDDIKSVNDVKEEPKEESMATKKTEEKSVIKKSEDFLENLKAFRRNLD